MLTFRAFCFFSYFLHLLKTSLFQTFRSHTCDPLHLHAPGLDAALGQPLLGDDAADVVGEDEVGLQDGQGLGVGVGAGLVDDDVQRSAVVLHPGHLHVLQQERG